jgi:adenylate kinase
MIVFLSGLSGVGKTTTARALVARQPQFRHIIASDLISRAGANIDPANEREVIRNQDILVQEFAAVRQYFRNYHFLLDGHMVIETNKGDHIIEDEVIDRLAVTHFIGIIDDPSRIHSTRRVIQKGCISSAELANLQTLEMSVTRRQAERTRRPFFQVWSGQVEALEINLGLGNQAIENILKPPRPV